MTAPATGVATPPTKVVKVNVALLIVSGFIGSLNVAEIAVFARTPVARLAGTVEMTVGAPVVKVHTKFAARVLPPGSVAPVVIVPIYAELAASGALGANVAVVPE